MTPDCPHEDLYPTLDGWSQCGCGGALAPRAVQLRVAPAPSGLALPVTWSQTLEDELVNLVQRGARPATAAEAVGVGPKLWKRWLDFADSGRQPFAGLVARAKQAYAFCRAEAQGAVRVDRPEAWLERNDPKWARKSTVEVKGKVQHEHKHVDLTALTLDELRVRRAELAAHAGDEIARLGAPHEDAIDVVTDEP